MPFTTNKGLSVQTLNANIGLWGTGAADSLNSGVMEPLDAMLGGQTALTLASSTPQLLTQSQAQNALLRLTGALLASIVISPDSGVLMTGFYYFENLTTNPLFTVTFTNAGGSVVLPQGRRGVMWVDAVNGPRVMSSVGSSQTDIIPVGSVMPFYNTAAPTGWTIVSSLNDYALKIVSSTGGVTSGSVAYSTLFGRTATDSHVLLEAQMPLHNHTSGSASTAAAGGTQNVISPPAAGNFNTTSAGSSQGHTHNIDMRVQTASIILATRN